MSELCTPTRGKPFTKGDLRAGRKLGSANLTTRIIKTAYTEAFKDLQNDPEHSLKAWATKRPTEFYKLASKIIPNQVKEAIQQSILTPLK